MRFGPFGDRAQITFAIAAAIVAALSLAVSSGGAISGDEAAAELAGSLRAAWLTDAMRVLTDVGAGTVVATVLIFASLGLAANRRWVELGVTVTGALAIVLGVPELKEGIGRGRPDDGMVSPESAAFPSGHAAQATVYVYLAFLIARLAPSPRMWLLIGAASVLALGIAASRVYIGAHHLSDVVGGIAFGAAAFTLWAVISLARGRLRQNLERD